MRPISLKICGFGSYGDKQPPIDFTVPQQNLFLVTGNTGSGKSTIFDAIVFALYGEVASESNKKNGEMLVSQFVKPGVTSYVELVFEENNERYTVRREPRQYAYKKNGERKATPESEKVSLILPDGREYPAKGTDDKIMELVGLTKAQFMQIAMIAQGEFMKVLRESSDDKKEVFRKLFDTEFYEKIQLELDSRCRDKKTEIARLMTEFRTEVTHTKIPDDYEDYINISSHRKAILDNDKINIVALEEFISDLTNMCLVLEKNAQEVQAKHAIANNELIEIAKEEATAKLVLSSFDALEKAQSAIQTCEEQKEAIDKMRLLVADIKKAYLIKVEYDKYESAANNYNNTNSAYKVDNELLSGLEEKQKAAEITKNSALKVKEISDEEFTSLKTKVDKALILFEDIKKTTDELNKAQKSEEKASEEYEADIITLAEFDEKIVTWEKRQSELDGAEVRLAECINRNSLINELRDDYSKLSRLSDEIESLEDDWRNRDVTLREVMSNYGALDIRYKTAYDTYLLSQAGILAKELKLNMPCPVCGSTDHPAPCKLSEEIELLSKEELETLKSELDTLDHKKNELSQAAGELKTLIDEKKKNLGTSRAELVNKINELANNKISNDAELDVIKQQILSCANDADKQFTIAKKDSDELIDIKNKLAQSLDSKKELEAKKEQSLVIYNAAKDSALKKKTELEALGKNLEFENETEANIRLADAAKDNNTKNKAYDAAYAEFISAKEAVDKCQERIRTAEEKLPDLLEVMNSLDNAYKSVMAEHKMKEEAWKQIVDSNKQNTTSLEEKIKEYDTTLSVALNQLETSKKDTAGKEKPDIVAIKEKLNAATDKEKVAKARSEECQSVYITNNGVLEHLKPGIKKHQNTIDEYGRLINVYNVLAGKLKGNKMDIETFVQRAYLEHILYAANRRFRDMSAGQFELKMCSIDKAGEGAKNQGLDLLVHSLITNQDRKINTLSGGESFMAALALALGMADEIQAKSAAVNLDIMFIDEGFGSLDDHSRNEAIKVLKAMAGGDKLVGIISHVTELKQEIDDLLVVTKDNNGSYAEWKN